MPNGWIITVAVLVPNLFWMLLPPTHVPASGKEARPRYTRAVEAVEWIGRIGVFVIPLFYNVELGGPPEQVSAGVLVCALIFYYAGWLRYFFGGREYRFLYVDLLKVPLPLAVSPVIYFAAASVILHSVPLAVATTVFGAAHLYVSYREAQGFAR
jgi:hypothetical protein